MHVRTMSLTAYRNIAKASLEFNPSFNILYGDNGQGKTNTIEAVYLALTGKSPREARNDSLIMHGESGASVICEVSCDDLTDTDAKVKIAPSGKVHMLNETRVRSRQELLDMFSAVFFGPDDMRVVKDSPQTRRDFLNESVSILYPGYASVLAEYNRILRQRSALLKEYSPSAESLLEVYDSSLASSGSDIIRCRIKFLKDLNSVAGKYYAQISSEREELSLSYISDILTEAVGSDDIRPLYEKKLAETRKNDIFAGTTTAGAHRDDISFFLDRDPARRFASQGQQRSIALSLTFALCELIEKKKGQIPVILLDDVMSELDRNRRDSVGQIIQGKQVFITCTNVDFDTDSSVTSYFRADNGNITETTK